MKTGINKQHKMLQNRVLYILQPNIMSASGLESELGLATGT